jgi:chromosome partitioning protein
MKTVAVLSQKGGAGKTTLAIHLAVASSQHGLNTLLVDLDPQASASKCSDRRKTSELPVVISTHASRLAPVLENARTNDGHLALLDTAPHSDQIALHAARAADLILIPCRPSILDLEAISSTLDLVRTVSRCAVVVLNAVAPAGREADEAAEAIAQLGAVVCPGRLVSRIAFARSFITGQAAQELEPEGKAAQEIESIHKFMCEQVQLALPQRELEHGQQVLLRA